MKPALGVAAIAAAALLVLSIDPGADALFGPLDGVMQDRVSTMAEQTRRVWDVAADVLVYGVAAGLCTGMVAQAAVRRDRAQGVAIALLLLAMAANDAILKPFFDRPRPPTAYVDTPAFPSGHTTAALLVSAALLFPRPTTRRVAIVAAVTGAVATARVLSGAHWVSDVLGSITYGTLVVALLQTNRRLVAPAADRIPRRGSPAD